jgi:RNA polymerase sigma-70 factor (ECF subfamily)
MEVKINNKDVCKDDVYKSIFFDYYESLRAFIYSKSGSYTIAEDIAQEAFLKLWIKCALIIFSKAKSFLYTVANNLFINSVKHEKVVLEYSKSFIENKSESPEFLLEEKEFKKKLEDAINTMSEKERTVFLMSRIEGLKYKEIAERIDVSVKSVEKRMSKALKIFSLKL